MVQFFSYLFNIRVKEWPRVLILYLMGILFLIGQTYGEISAEAAFLSHGGIAIQPLMFIADAIIAIVTIAVYTLLVDRIANDKLLLGIIFLAIVLIITGYYLTQTNISNAAYTMLYLLSHVVRDTFILHWWTYSTSFYDARASKRIMPMLVTNARVGGIIAGFTLPTLSRLFTANHISSDTMFPVWALVMVFVAITVWMMPRVIRDSPEATAAPVATKNTLGSYIRSLQEGSQYITQSSFLRWMALSTFVMIFLLTLLNYVHSVIFATVFKSPDTAVTTAAITNYISNLQGITNLIMFPIQLFILSRIVNRFGLGNSNLIFPVATLGVAGALVAFPASLAVAGLAYFDRMVLRASVRNTIDNLLYNAVPLRVKGRARAVISGLVVPIGSLVGGVTVLFLPRIPGALELLPVGVFVLALVYFWSAVVVRNQYGRALVTMLEQEDFSFMVGASADLTVTDPAALNFLKKKIDESTNPETTLFLARLLADLNSEASLPILLPMAKSENPQVRAAAVDALVTGDSRSDAVRQLLTSLLSDPDSRVRQSAITGLSQWADQGSEQFLALSLQLLRDPELEVSLQVVPSLLRSGDAFYAAAAARRLAPIWLSQEPVWQARGIQVLGQTRDSRYIYNLLDYLSNPDDEIRIESVIAIEGLAKYTLSRGVSDALSSHVDTLLNDPIERVRSAGLTILGYVNSSTAQTTLFNALSDPSPAIRETAANALVRMGKPIIPHLLANTQSENLVLRQMVTVMLGRMLPKRAEELIRAFIHDNLMTIYVNNVRLAALVLCVETSGKPKYRGLHMLLSVFREQNARLMDEIFYLLSATHDPKAMKLIAESLRSDTLRVRSNALEAIESLTTPQIAVLLAPLFDPELSPNDLLERSKTISGIEDNPLAILRAMLTDSSDEWLRTLVSFSVGELWADLNQDKSAQPKSLAAAIEDSVNRTREFKAASFARREVAEKKEQDKKAKKRVSPLDLLAGGDSEKKASEPAAPVTSIVPASPCEELFTREQLKTLIDLASADALIEVQRAIYSASFVQAAANKTNEGSMLSIIEKIIFLKDVSFFEGMTIDQLKILAGVCEEETFNEDTLIFKEGDPGGVVYVVVKGKVAIEVEGARKGSTSRIATIEANSYFGEMRLFDNSPRSERARAIQDTLTLRLRREPLIALTRQYPDLSLKLINVLSQRLRDANERIAQLTASKPRELQKLYDKLD